MVRRRVGTALDAVHASDLRMGSVRHRFWAESPEDLYAMRASAERLIGLSGKRVDEPCALENAPETESFGGRSPSNTRFGCRSGHFAKCEAPPCVIAGCGTPARASWHRPEGIGCIPASFRTNSAWRTLSPFYEIGMRYRRKP